MISLVPSEKCWAVFESGAKRKFQRTFFPCEFNRMKQKSAMVAVLLVPFSTRVPTVEVESYSSYLNLKWVVLSPKETNLARSTFSADSADSADCTLSASVKVQLWRFWRFWHLWRLWAIRQYFTDCIEKDIFRYYTSSYSVTTINLCVWNHCRFAFAHINKANNARAGANMLLFAPFRTYSKSTLALKNIVLPLHI